MRLGTNQLYNFEGKKTGQPLQGLSPEVTWTWLPGSSQPSQGGLPRGRGGATLVFPALENNNPLQPFHSSALSAKQQNWRLMKPGGEGRMLGSKQTPPFSKITTNHPHVYKNEGLGAPPTGTPRSVHCFGISPV